MKILITAGPTYERIDPVRFIGNYSSGKMGFAIAEACLNAGHEVVLIAGPVQLTLTHPNLTRIDVENSQQMYDQVMTHFPKCDGAIFCAAVADFTPETVADKKIKRENDDLIIRLKPTHDIAAAAGNIKKEKQFMVGFALETDQEEQHALDKMRRKRLDFIVLNSLKDKDACFGYDTNKVTIYKTTGEKISFPLKTKREVANDILNEIYKITNQ